MNPGHNKEQLSAIFLHLSQVQGGKSISITLPALPFFFFFLQIIRYIYRPVTPSNPSFHRRAEQKHVKAAETGRERGFGSWNQSKNVGFCPPRKPCWGLELPHTREVAVGGLRGMEVCVGVMQNPAGTSTVDAVMLRLGTTLLEDLGSCCFSPNCWELCPVHACVGLILQTP